MAKSFKITDRKGKVQENKEENSMEEGIKEKTVKTKPTTSESSATEPVRGNEKKQTLSEKREEKKINRKEKGERKNILKHIPWKKLLFPAVALLALVGIALFYYFGIFKVRPIPLEEVLSFNEMFVASKSNERTFSEKLDLLSIPEEPRTEESPLNGMLFSKSEMKEMMARRPVGVMINNHVEARPLSGLNIADIVIEANVESGITRLLGIFWSKAPQKVGPIRSLRQPYLERASEYDPLLIYDGCAQTDNPKTNACGNVHSYGIRIIATIGAWRSNEGGRVAPHNEYSSVSNAWEYAKKMDWDKFPSSIQSYEFKRDAQIADRGKKTDVKISFHTRLENGGQYVAQWTYDPSTNSYLRKIGGKADMDTETNSQVSAKVVIIQEVKVVPSGDDKGRLITTTIGKGDAIILQDGKIVNGSWEKDSRTDRTKYYDSSGNPIKFNRGRIWISMMPHSDGKFDIIEQ